MAAKKIRHSREKLKDWLGKEIKIDFSTSGVIGNSVEGVLKEIYEDGVIELVRCTNGLPNRLVQVDKAVTIGAKD